MRDRPKIILRQSDVEKAQKNAEAIDSKQRKDLRNLWLLMQQATAGARRSYESGKLKIPCQCCGKMFKITKTRGRDCPGFDSANIVNHYLNTCVDFSSHHLFGGVLQELAKCKVDCSVLIDAFHHHNLRPKK